MKVEWYGVSEVGRRVRNEDAYQGLPEWGLFAIADGMGGYKGGDVASGLAMKSVRDFFGKNLEDVDVTWPFTPDQDTFLEGMVEVSMRWAHRSVQAKRTGELNQMGSTLSMMVLADRVATIGHIGDSRIYRVRKGRIEQLTSDHSLYEELKRGGTPMPPLKDFIHKNVITRALGMESRLRPDVLTTRVRRGDTYLLCTDGLCGTLSDDELLELLKRRSLPDLCQALARHAYEAGSRDNITAVVVRIR